MYICEGAEREGNPAPQQNGSKGQALNDQWERQKA